MREYISLSNGIIEVKADTLGAQLLSIRDAVSGREYLWQGDKRVWTMRAPVLFPICGSLKNDAYIYDGREYKLTKHGFARFMLFELEEYDKHRAVLCLKSNKETRKSYPFEFEFRVTFELDGSALRVTYSVKNMSDWDMYFSFGAHEGFMCRGGADRCTLRFEGDSSVERFIIKDGLYTGETEQTELADGKLRIDYAELKRCTYIFKNFRSNAVVLSDAEGDIVRVSFEDITTLAVWSVENSEFVCIEPWVGFPDSADNDGDIRKKTDIVCLGVGKSFTRTHSIAVP